MPRDFRKSYSAAELEGLNGIFRGMPSYKEDGYISATDLPVLLKLLDYRVTPEEMPSYLLT